MDAFISHSSKNAALARRIEQVLERQGLELWLDDSEIRVGALLRRELQSAIKASRTVVLIWSKPASMSRWITAEVITAFHMGRFIVPCVADATPLPYFLRNTIYLDFARSTPRALERLPRAVTGAPRKANDVPPMLAAAPPRLTAAIDAINRMQHDELEALGNADLRTAKAIHARNSAATRRALAKWPLDATILNLAGYHAKNGYVIKHWDALQAGRPPSDPLLAQAERFFFETLFVNPVDYSALNGLGSVLTIEREYDAAEFFVKRAIALAKRDKVEYPEAQHDLALIKSARRLRA